MKKLDLLAEELDMRTAAALLVVAGPRRRRLPASAARQDDDIIDTATATSPRSPRS